MVNESTVADFFSTLAESVERNHSKEIILEAINRTEASCRHLAAHADSAQTRKLCANIQTALNTWKAVWPRLGQQPEFRLAVAREARLWSRRFEEALR